MKIIIYLIVILTASFVYSQDEEYTVMNLKMNTNTPHFGLVVNQNGTALLVSYKIDKKGKILKFKKNPVLTLFEGKQEKTGEVSNLKHLNINESENLIYITSATYAPDGKKLYITTNYINRKPKPKGNYKASNFHIEVAEYIEGKGWANFKVLPFCKPNYSYAHPNISPDGKTLYFTANIRGGKETTRGSSDIFKVDILENNTYSKPKNLGIKVNSYSKEMFPFMSKDNVLYFASNRPNGFGGFDIYKSVLNNDNTFKKAIKLPKPINSNKNDFGLIFISDNEGYFTSNRTGGKGDDDIYYFKKE